jgi:MFS family permease
MLFAMCITEMAADIHIPILPLLREAFDMPAQYASLTLSSCFGGLFIGSILYGPLADAYGRIRVFMLSLIILAISSLAAAYAVNTPMLMIASAFQGLGMAGGYILALTVVRDLFTGISFVRALTKIHMVEAAAPIFGSIGGCYLAETFSWQTPFVLLSVLAAIAIFMMHKMPETIPPETKQNFSIENAFRAYLAVVKNIIFIGYATIPALIYGGFWLFFSEMPHVFQEQGLKLMDFSYIQGFMVLCYLVGAKVNQRLLGVVNTEKLLIGGLGMCFGSGGIMLVISSFFPESLYWMSACMVIFSIGMSFVDANTISKAMDLIPSNMGVASSTLTSLFYLIPAAWMSLLSFYRDDSAYPMALFILGASLCAFFLYFVVSYAHSYKQATSMDVAYEAQ